MESYKLSCPFCGQHIEYTVGYCGKQMQCPICSQTVTFPALPPGRSGPTLHVKSLERKPERKWSWKLPAALTFLLKFQHWNVVAQCAVPFLIIGVLLAGAAQHLRRRSRTDRPWHQHAQVGAWPASRGCQLPA